jgi:hypothetical protein
MKRTGTSTAGVEASAAYRRKQARRRRAEQFAWEERSGPTLLKIGDFEIEVTSKARKDIKAARDLLLRAIEGEDVPGVVRRGT